MSCHFETLSSTEDESRSENSDSGPERKLLDNELEKVCHHFTTREISNYIVPLLPNLAWNKLKKGIQTYKLKLNPGNLGKLIVHLLKNEKDNDFRHVVNRTCLLDVALHSSNVWIPYLLLQPTVQSRVESTEQLEKLVLQAIRIEKMNGDIYATRVGGFFFLMVVYKKLTRKKGVVLTAPLYFSVCAEEPYVFVLKKQLPEKTLPFIVKALGFENYKKQSRLSGKNIQSLLQLLKNKASGMKIHDDLPYAPVEYYGHRSAAYLENEERLRHATHYLGEDTIMLEELSVTGPQEFEGDFDDFIDKDFNTAMKIRTKDVCGFIKHLAWKGAVRPPFPNYIKKLNVIGKSEITLKSVRGDKNNII